MPHSIHLFLEQVDHGLYDRTASFHTNADNMLKAGPSSTSLKFQQHPSLNSVLFPEYSFAFPHLAYTIGYANGGPDFFINLKDNSRQQRGQENADPCFARIVKGREVIQRLHQQPVDWQDILVHPVKIARMQVISHQEYERLTTATQPAPPQATTREYSSEY